MLIKLYIHTLKTETRSLSLTLDKNQVKMDWRPSRKISHWNVLEENIGETFYDLGIFWIL
jgi:hypothetical protein